MRIFAEMGFDKLFRYGSPKSLIAECKKLFTFKTKKKFNSPGKPENPGSSDESAEAHPIVPIDELPSTEEPDHKKPELAQSENHDETGTFLGEVLTESVPQSENRQGNNLLPWTFEIVWDVFEKREELCTIDGDAPERNIVVGPYRSHSFQSEVEEKDFAPESPLAKTVQDLREKGLNIRTGIWKIDGSPPAVLFDTKLPEENYSNEFHVLSEQFNIDIPANDGDAHEAVVFGLILTEFLARFQHYNPIPMNSESSMTTALFHDWKCSVAPIFLHHFKIPVFNILTLHSLEPKTDKDTAEEMVEEAHGLGKFHRLSILRVAVEVSDIFSVATVQLADQSGLVFNREPDYVVLKNHND